MVYFFFGVIGSWAFLWNMVSFSFVYHRGVVDTGVFIGWVFILLACSPIMHKPVELGLLVFILDFLFYSTMYLLSTWYCLLTTRENDSFCLPWIRLAQECITYIAK